MEDNKQSPPAGQATPPTPQVPQSQASEQVPTAPQVAVQPPTVNQSQSIPQPTEPEKVEQPTPQVVMPSHEEPGGGGSSKNILIVVVCVVVALAILGGAAYLIMNRKTQQVAVKPPVAKILPSPTQMISPTPTVVPVTAANADQTLNNTDTGIQQSLNQVNTDMSNLDSISPAQDNPNSL